MWANHASQWAWFTATASGVSDTIITTTPKAQQETVEKIVAPNGQPSLQQRIYSVLARWQPKRGVARWFQSASRSTCTKTLWTEIPQGNATQGALAVVLFPPTFKSTSDIAEKLLNSSVNFTNPMHGFHHQKLLSERLKGKSPDLK